MSRAGLAIYNHGLASQEGGEGASPLPLATQNTGLPDADVVSAIVESCVVGTGGSALPLLRYKTMFLGRGLREAKTRPDLIRL